MNSPYAALIRIRRLAAFASGDESFSASSNKYSCNFSSTIYNSKRTFQLKEAGTARKKQISIPALRSANSIESVRPFRRDGEEVIDSTSESVLWLLSSRWEGKWGSGGGGGGGGAKGGNSLTWWNAAANYGHCRTRKRVMSVREIC